MYTSFHTLPGPYDESSSDSEDEVALGTLQSRMLKQRRNDVREAINGRLQSVRNEDGFAQLLASVTSINATVQHISAAVSTMQNHLTQLQEDVNLIKRNRDLLKRIVHNTSPGTSTSSASATPAGSGNRQEPQITPETPRTARPSATDTTSNSPYKSRYISAPTPGKMFLGGDEGMERDITWYEQMLKMVSWKKKDTDQDRGRLLCMKLFRAEFSKEDLAMKNVTGFTRDNNHKIVIIPTLEQRVLFAIFNQAKTQFPLFSDWYTMRSSATVKDLNDICKKARKDRNYQVVAETNPDDVVVADEADAENN